MNIPNVSTAPRIVVDLPNSTIEAFRLGWACGQVDMARRYWNRVGDALSREDEKRLRERILRGPKK